MKMNELFGFLQKLSQNNSREWFNENKSQFEKIKKEFDDFVNKLIPKIHSIDSRIGQITAKECVFRIYRDVRFSLNKDPYKTHFGAYISNAGRKSVFAGYYLHLQPGSSFLAAGAYTPTPQNLHEIRYEIMENINEFKKIINDAKFTRYFSKIGGEQLKIPPKGFPKDFPDIELLKFKSYEIMHNLDESMINSDKFVEYILDLVKIALPYNTFMNRAIQNAITNE